MPTKKVAGDGAEAAEVQKWFLEHVTFEGERYTVDIEQAQAILDDGRNTMVVARAGSGKTRTIVAKIIYLVAQRGIKPSEIMAFVFNANAAAEINARLEKMLVDGENVINGVKIASTFHAFSRKVVYDTYGGQQTCGDILASEREGFMLMILRKMMLEPYWAKRMVKFMTERECQKPGECMLKEKEWAALAKLMDVFICRAQQRFLTGEDNLKEAVAARLMSDDVNPRERRFLEIGQECFKRYHWYLFNKNDELKGAYRRFRADFNLIVAWAGEIITRGGEKAQKMLAGKRYLLIDEYQDFSQLFLSVVMAIRFVRPEIKLFVVGDDWQAINRFAGSDVQYFKEFERFFPEGARKLEISTNYRCDYEIVNTARRFMHKAMGEKGEFKAFSRRPGRVMVVDPKETKVKMALVGYDARVGVRDRIYVEMTRRMARRYPKSKTVQYIKTVVRIIRENCKTKDILILHRNNETELPGIGLVGMQRELRWGLERLGVMTGVEFDAKVRVMTMHKSKGLEAEVVVILGADEGVIPVSHPDVSLQRIFGETEEVAVGDQKRLFYVAMTRAKKRLYIIHNGGRGDKSGFMGFLGRGVEKW